MPKCKNIVTDIYDFPTLIGEGYVYVDKTALLRRMISGVDGRFFFMSRPRRFGKSLMISTLEQIFKGNRKLFKGLDIAKSDYDWKRYPVLRLDMSQVRATDIAGYRKVLCGMVSDVAKRYSLDLSGEDNPGRCLGHLIETMAEKGEKVSVLIDEYDAPISGLLDHPELLDAVRALLHDLYVMFKVRSDDIHFLMMTGVSKFTKLSVFSGMNNLTDISMSPAYASLLGYTREEVEQVFGPQVKAFAKQSKKTCEVIIEDLLAWYDSYRFSPESEVCVCNPVSVGRALQERRFYGFWNATGNATLIIERLRKARKGPLDLDGLTARPEQLDICDAERLPIEALLYQGGYLTIDHPESSGLLALRVPNREVRQVLDSGYVAGLLKEHADDFENGALRFATELDGAKNLQASVSRVMVAIFGMVPHEWKMKSEAEVKRYFLLFMRMAGATINAEVESSSGRADAILETQKSVYVFEFKYNKTARAALKQCRDRQYAAPYATDKRRVVCVGINFKDKGGTIEVVTEPVTEPVNAKAEPVNEPVNEPVFFTVLNAIAQHPGCRRPTLLREVKISEATMKRVLSRLAKNGRIEFRGAPKTGGYYVL